jgi:putative transcriptional regulator
MHEKSRVGQLLAATPMLGDANFRRTIVLVVEDDQEEGTLGVVLNRPSEIPVRQVLEPWTPLVTGPSVLFHGGPVAPDSALALAMPHNDSEPIGWRSLAGSKLMSRVGLVDLGAPPELLADGIASLRVFAGYAGWGAGQLDAEIEMGAWLVLEAKPEDAFAPEPGQLYPSVLRRQGGDMALLSTYPDDPVLN